MIRSLRKKFILINMLLVAVVLTVVFSAQCVSKYQQLQDESVRALEMMLSRNIDQKPPRFEVGQQRPHDFIKKVMFVAEIDGNGVIRLLWADDISVSDEWLSLITEEILLSEKEQGVLNAENLRYKVRQGKDAVKIAFIDITDDTLAIRNTVLTATFSYLLALGAFLLTSLYLSYWALRPVENAWEQQRRFVADASHELKTPLTVILANIGILKSNRASTVEEQLSWVENTEAEATQMKQLVENLLFLAKTDSAQPAAVQSMVNLSDVLLSTALAFESVAYEKMVVLETTAICPDIYVLGNESQLKQLIAILLDNAVKYSNKRAEVNLSLDVKQAKAELTVVNSGRCLSQTNINQIFDRFYRADQSRSSEGYGLGLSIAKNIVELHSGKISVRSDEIQGNAFTVVMPAIINQT